MTLRFDKTSLFLFVFVAAVSIVGARPASAASTAEELNVKFKSLEKIRLTTILESLSARGSIDFPAAFSGIWAYVDSTHECSSSDFTVENGLDTLCTGEAFDIAGQAPPEITLDCSGSTITDTSVNIHCTGSGFLDPCNVSVEFNVTGTRNGDTIVSTSTSEIISTGDLFCNFTQCYESFTTLQRTAPEPSDCTTAVEGSTWGMIKALYR